VNLPDASLEHHSALSSSATMSGAQEIRFRRPTNVPQEKKEPKTPIENNQIFKEQVRKTHRPWTPSFSLAVRVLFLVRVAAAMYSNIDDCDEGEHNS
jgi:alpha-1,2-mannosyltransferase